VVAKGLVAVARATGVAAVVVVAAAVRKAEERASVVLGAASVGTGSQGAAEGAVAWARVVVVRAQGVVAMA